MVFCAIALRAHRRATRSKARLVSKSREEPDPDFSPFSRKSRIPHYFSSLSRNPFFVSKIHKLKRPIAAKAKKVTDRLALSIDILNLRGGDGVLRPLQYLLMPQYDEAEGESGRNEEVNEILGETTERSPV